jgi:hypothetical protein
MSWSDEHRKPFAQMKDFPENVRRLALGNCFGSGLSGTEEDFSDDEAFVDEQSFPFLLQAMNQLGQYAEKYAADHWSPPGLPELEK